MVKWSKGSRKIWYPKSLLEFRGKGKSDPFLVLLSSESTEKKKQENNKTLITDRSCTKEALRCTVLMDFLIFHFQIRHSSPPSYPPTWTTASLHSMDVHSLYHSQKVPPLWASRSEKRKSRVAQPIRSAGKRGRPCLKMWGLRDELPPILSSMSDMLWLSFPFINHCLSIRNVLLIK